MSYPVNFQTLPAAVFEDVFTPENVRGRNSTNSLMLLSFPKSRSALWDGPSGDMLRLQLCSHRKPRVVLLEKALRLAQRHVHHSNKPRLHCFFLGSVCVDSDEEGVTVTLNRFDPGRDQVGSSARVPTALLPGDVLVPCLFSTQTETSPVIVIQSEAEIHHSVKALQQFVSSRQTLDLSQLIKVRGLVVCSQQSDAMAFSLSWSAICPSVSMDVQPVRAIPIIPTALLRSLIGVGRTLQHTTNCHRGFLTMDQTRKLLLLLESDPKAANLPLVGLWLSGVTHIYNPQVMSWCLRFLFSTALQERVLSESGCFLLVLFAATHRAPQFFQCRGPGPVPGLQLDCEFLSASQSVTLYQVASVDGQSLQCELSSDDHRQTETFRAAQTSFNSAPPSAAGVSVTDQDSGVEDEDLSPRPSPSPHAPAQQSRRVQPSVPELSLLIDSSFTWQDPGSAHRCLPLSSADRKSSAPTGSTPPSSSPAPRPPPPHLHSTPNSNLQVPSTCYPPYTCNSTPILSSAAPPPPTFRNHPMTPPAPPSSTRGLLPPPSHGPSSPPSLLLPPAPPGPCSHPPLVSSPPPSLPPPPYVNQCTDQVGGVVPSDTYQVLLHQDRQLRLLQAQVQMLLEAQMKHVNTQESRSTTSVAVGTGASLFWANPVQPLPHQETQAPPPTSPSSPSPSSSCRHSSSHDLSITETVGSSEVCDITNQMSPCSPTGQHSCLQSPAGVTVSMCRDEQQSFYKNLMTQLTSRLQESDHGQEVESRRRSESAVSSPSRRRQQSSDPVVSATLRQLQQLGVDVDKEDLTESDRNRVRDVESVSTLASINPAAVVSRLGVSDLSVSSLCSGGSVDLSLEANAIALRYLSDSQLSRLSLGGHAPRLVPTSSSDYLLSPSNMSLGTRQYMRKYGLIEEEDDEEEEEQEEVKVQEVSTRQPLTEALNVKPLPQSQLIRDLLPKIQLLARKAAPLSGDKENCSSKRPSLMRTSKHQTEGSVGNILDLSRLRQLPKLF